MKVNENKEAEQKMSFITSIKFCLKHDQWLVLVIYWVIMAFGMAMSMSVVTYYAKYILGNENFAG